MAVVGFSSMTPVSSVHCLHIFISTSLNATLSRKKRKQTMETDTMSSVTH